MNTLCPHIFISKSLLKYLPAHFDIINRTLDIFRNRDFSAVANYHGYTEKGPLKINLTYTIQYSVRLRGVGGWVRVTLQEPLLQVRCVLDPSWLHKPSVSSNLLLTVIFRHTIRHAIIEITFCPMCLLRLNLEPNFISHMSHWFIEICTFCLYSKY